MAIREAFTTHLRLGGPTFRGVGLLGLAYAKVWQDILPVLALYNKILSAEGSAYSVNQQVPVVVMLVMPFIN